MPRSQRNQKVSLTKTDKKGRELKQGIVSEVRKCVDEYPSVYVFSFVNLRSKLLKEVRMDFRKDSRFFMGKNKVMMLALGKSEQDEYQDNLRQVSKRLKGQVSFNLGAMRVWRLFGSGRYGVIEADNWFAVRRPLGGLRVLETLSTFSHRSQLLRPSINSSIVSLEPLYLPNICRPAQLT